MAIFMWICILNLVKFQRFWRDKNGFPLSIEAKQDIAWDVKAIRDL